MHRGYPARRRKARRRNRAGAQPAGPGRARCFSAGKERDVPAQPAGLPAARKKILTARGERSERPVALPTAPARLNKPEYATGPAAGDAPGGTRAWASPADPAPGMCLGLREPGPPAGLPAAAPQGPAGFRRQPGPAEVGLLALGVPGAVAAAAVGHLGLAGDRVGVVDAVLDDLRPVGEHQLRTRPGILRARRRPGRRPAARPRGPGRPRRR